MSPSGIKSKDRFDLTLKIEIKDKNEVVSIDITVVGIFYFRENIDIKMLPHYFAVNAPAIISIYKSIYITTDIIVRCWNSFVANIEFVIFE